MIAATLGLLVAPVLLLVARRKRVAVTVDINSMMPTLRPGERVLVRRVPFAPGPQRRHRRAAKTTCPNRTWMIKRVLAVPGDPVPRGQVPVFCGYADAVIPPGRLVVLGVVVRRRRSEGVT